MKGLPLLPQALPFGFDLVERIRFAALVAHRVSGKDLAAEGELGKHGKGAVAGLFLFLLIFIIIFIPVPPLS